MQLGRRVFFEYNFRVLSIVRATQMHNMFIAHDVLAV